MSRSYAKSALSCSSEDGPTRVKGLRCWLGHVFEYAAVGCVVATFVVGAEGEGCSLGLLPSRKRQLAGGDDDVGQLSRLLFP